jgi:hypothetical protein
MVYGGCGNAGIDMSRAVMLGFAFIYDAIGVAHVDSVSWFLTDDALSSKAEGFKEGSLITQLLAEAEFAAKKAKEGSYVTVTAEALLMERLFGGSTATPSCWLNCKANNYDQWNKATVVKYVTALGGAGKDRVILVLVGHGSKAGDVAIDTKTVTISNTVISGADVRIMAASCASFLAVVGACHSDALFVNPLGVWPPSLLSVSSAPLESTDDHAHLRSFLVTMGWALETVRTEFPMRCRATYSTFQAWIAQLVTKRAKELKDELKAKHYGMFDKLSSIQEAFLPAKITAIVRHHEGAANRQVMSIFDSRAEELARVAAEVQARAEAT